MLSSHPIRQCLKQISMWNPLVNAITTINPNIQDLLSVEHDDNVIPVFVKDSIMTEDWLTTCASPVIYNHYLENKQVNAPVVQQMLDHGSVFVAKTTCPEFCMNIQTVSEMNGVTRNPYDLSLTSGGSSGGSAVAVSVGMVPLALGSDMAGSLRIPSAFCGVYSLRPTAVPFSESESLKIDRKYVNYRGHTPPAPIASQDRIDPEYNCPLSVIGAIASNMNYLQKFVQMTTDLKQKSESTDPIRIAVTTSFPGVQMDYRIVEGITQSFMEPLSDFARNGISCNVKAFNDTKLSLDQLKAAYITLSSPLGNAINKLLGETETLQVSLPMQTALEYQARQQEVFDEFLSEYDCWVVPVTPVLPFPHNPENAPLSYEIRDGNDIVVKQMAYWKSISLCTPITVLGNPVVTLPFCMVKHGDKQLPLAVQVIGKRNCELDLIQVCKRLESIFHDKVDRPNIHSLLQSRL